MEDNENKIKRALKAHSVFNWTRLIRARSDDTRFQIERVASGENFRSLRPAYRLCRQLANREADFENLIQKAESYEGFAHDSSTEILPELHRYLIENQIETVQGFAPRTFKFPLGLGPRDRMLTVPTDPDFVTVRGDRLEPNFLLGWANDPFKLMHMQLISGIIGISVLSREDFRGCDARVITFRRDEWTGKRVCRSWMISQYGGISEVVINEHVARYNRALRDYVNSLGG